MNTWFTRDVSRRGLLARLVALLTALLTMLGMGLVGVQSAQAAATEYIVNGSFDYPKLTVAADGQNAWNQIDPSKGQWLTSWVSDGNGGFNVTWSNISDWNKNKFAWNSTQTAGEAWQRAGAVEIQKDINGNQYVELCANQEGTAIYQDIQTEPGVRYTVSLDHASQTNRRVDKMQVLIGPSGKETAVNMTRTKSNKAGDKVGETSTTIATTATNTSEINPTTNLSSRNHAGQWAHYKGSYVATGTVTRFTFKSLSGGDVGNLLDNVSFIREYPFTYDVNAPSGTTAPSTPSYKGEKGDNYVTEGDTATDTSGWKTGDTTKIKGYRFDGWYTDKAGTKEYDWNTEVTSSTKVYAKWTRLSTAVKYDANGGKGSHADTTGWQYTDVNVPDDTSKSFSREHYVFTGWNTKADGTGTAVKDGDKVSLKDSPVTLYAQWKGLPVVEATKTADAKSAKVGDIITYTVTVKNSGPGDTQDATATDTLGKGLEFVSATGDPTVSGQRLVWKGLALKSGESKVFTVKAKATSEAKDQVVNTITGGCSDGCDPDPDPTPVDVPMSPDLKVEKTTKAKNAKVGDVIEYTVTVSNQGKRAANDTTVTDTLGEGLEFVSASGNGLYQDGKIVWEGLQLDPGDSKSFTVKAKATQAAGEQVVNSAEASDPDDPDTPTDEVDTPMAAELKVVKTTATEKAWVGDEIEYTVTVTNHGKGAAKDASVKDTPGEGLELVSASDGGKIENGNAVWSGLNLAPGESKSFTVKAKATSQAGDKVSNKVEAVCSQNCVADPPDEVDVPMGPDLKVTKTADREYAKPGETIAYTVTVLNEGKGVAKDTTVTDTLGEGLEFVSASDNGVYQDGKIEWSGVNLAAGKSRTFTVKAKVTDAAEDKVTNKAQAACSDCPVNPPAKVDTPLAADLKVTKTTKTKTAKADAVIEYTITVTNQGKGAAKNASVTDELGKGLKFVSASANGTNDGSEITWSKLVLAPGESKTFTVKAKVTSSAKGQVINTALASDPSMPEPSKASVTVTVEAEPLAFTGANAAVLVVVAVTLAVTAAGVGVVRRKTTTR